MPTERESEARLAGLGASAGAGETGNAHGRASRYRPPLYLQHEGHSRTVVGIERRVDGVRTKKVTWNLLIWDPLKQGTQLRRAFSAGSTTARTGARGNAQLTNGGYAASTWAGSEQGGTWESMVKRGVHTLRSSQYQVLYVPPQVISAPDRQTCKHFKGVAYKP